MTAPKKPTLTDDGRDARTEKWLDELKVDWWYEPALDLATIDRTKSLVNQARIEPLDREVVDRYEIGYRRGDRFPPLLAHRTSQRAKKLVLLGGNHRTAAATAAGVKTHPAYIVTALDPTVAHALSYGDNRLHGLPPSTSERITHAVHLVNMGMGTLAAAELCGVSDASISIRRKAQEGAARARIAGITGFDRLSGGTQTYLARIQADPVFEAAARLVIDANMSGPDTDKLAKAIVAARSEAAALKVVDEARTQRTTQVQHTAAGKKTGGRGATEYDRLRDLLTRLTTIDPVKVHRSVPNSDVRKVTRVAITAAGKKLVAVDQLLSGK